MGVFRFSQLAGSDLRDISRKTARAWGVPQARRYLDRLEAGCQALADNPGVGHACDDVRLGLRRLEVGRHVVFYRPTPEGIFVVRILHDRMLPGRHIPDEQEDDA